MHNNLIENHYNLTNDPWVITEPAFNNLLTMKEATQTFFTPTLDHKPYTLFNDCIAIIPVVGPLFKRVNIFSLISGGSCYEQIQTAFTAAIADPTIQGIVFDIDSPGGEVNGCSELAQMIYDSRGIKPIKAYASGACASGAYWLGSACDELHVAETACVGAIGVIGLYRNQDKSQWIEIISSQSPFKQLDPKTDEGRLRLQKRIDTLADVFIQAIARHRDVSKETVINHFGGGDVFVGTQAVQSGLADKLSTLEKTIASITLNKPLTIQQGALPMPTDDKATLDQPLDKKTLAQPLDLESLQQDYPELSQQLINQGIAEGRQVERSRIDSIITTEAAKGREQLAQHLAFATELTAELAVNTLCAAPIQQETTQATHGFNEVMASIKNPRIEPSEEIEDNPDLLAKRIANFGRP